ncbi:uncharacterized [Tachysurus ichikawai]
MNHVAFLKPSTECSIQASWVYAVMHFTLSLWNVFKWNLITGKTLQSQRYTITAVSLAHAWSTALQNVNL